MNDADTTGMTYQILDALEQLDKQLSRLIFAKLLLHHYIVEELSLRSKFEDKVDAVAFVKRILEAEDIGMADPHQDANLLL